MAYFKRKGGILLITTLASVVFGLCAAVGEAEAQAWYDDCVWNCTAREIQVTRIYLGDASGNDLVPCNIGDPATAYVWVEFRNLANDPREQITLTGALYVDGVFTQQIEECVLDAIPANGTSLVSIYSFDWICGETVELTDLLIFWNTSGDQCAGNADPDDDYINNRQCNRWQPAKCFRAPTIFVEVPFPLIEADKTYSIFDDVAPFGVPSPGDTLVYTITIVNSGSRDATGVVYEDLLTDTNLLLVPGSVTTTRGTVVGTGVRVDIGTIADGEAVTVTYRAMIASPLPAGVSVVSNQGRVMSNELPEEPTNDPSTALDDDPTVAPVQAQPLLEADKTHSLAVDADASNSVSPGDTLEYAITIVNSGNAGATGVVYEDLLTDQNLTLVSGSVITSQGTVTVGNTPGDTRLRANIGTLSGGGGTVTVTYRALVSSPFPAGVGVVSNQGRVMSNEVPEEPTNDPTTEPDDDPTLVRVHADPALNAEKTDQLEVDADGDGFPSPGDTLLYQVTIVNTGNASATGVFYNDLVSDSHLQLVSGTVQTSRGAVIVGNGAGHTSVNVEIGLIAGDGDKVSITYQALIDSPLPAGVTRVANQGTVESLQLSEVPTDDPDTEPLGDPTVTPVQAAPRLEAEKTDQLEVDADGDGFPSPGDTLLYLVTIANAGNAEATEVVYQDLVSDLNLTLVSGTVQTSSGTVTTGNAPGDTAIRIDVGSIPGGAKATVTYQAEIADPLPAGATQVRNQGLVSATGLPEEPTDDPLTPPDDDPTITQVTAAPLVEADKTAILKVDADGDGEPSPGDTLLYQVTLRNCGNVEATGMVYRDFLSDPHLRLEPGTVQTTPSALTVVSGNAPADSSVVVLIGTMGVCKEAIKITYQARISDAVPAGTAEVANQGFVATNELPEEPTDDPATALDDDPTRVPVSAEPLLEATKTVQLCCDHDGDGMESAGDELLYQIQILNLGHVDMTGVVFNDTPDLNTTLAAGTVNTSQGMVVLGNTAGDTSVRVNVGSVARHETVTITFRVVIHNPLPGGVFQVANQGFVGSNELPDEPTDDPSTPVDDDPTILVVMEDPLVEVTKTDSLVDDSNHDGVAGSGDVLLYAVHIVNSGHLDLTGVVFNDTPDANTTLVAGSVQTSRGTVVSGNDAGDTSVTVNVGTLGHHAAATITFRVTVNGPVPAGVASVVNQGFVGLNELPGVASDDPSTPEENDPTRTPVVAAPPAISPEAVPTAGELGKWMLTAGLFLASLLYLQRRRRVG